MGRDLTNLKINQSYQELVQISGSILTDGLGNEISSLNLLGFVPTNRTITTSTGLSGGGDLSANRVLTNTDRGSSQNIFKNIANSAGTTQFSAGNNSDSIRFAGSGSSSVSFDGGTNTITISSVDNNTTYSEISEAEIDTGSASTLRTITGRRAQYIINKARTGLLSDSDSLSNSFKYNINNFFNNKPEPNNITEDINLFDKKNIWNNSEDYSDTNLVIKSSGMVVDEGNFIDYKGIKLVKAEGDSYFSSVNLRQSIFTIGKRYMVSFFAISPKGETRIWHNIQNTTASGHGAKMIDENVRRVWFIGEATSTQNLDTITIPTQSLGTGTGTFPYLLVSKSTTVFTDLYFGGIQIEEIPDDYVDGIVWIGDSTIDRDSGTNDFVPSTDIPKYVGSLLNVNCFNRAVGGERLDQMDSRWSTDITPLAVNCKYVVIQGGINDISQSRTLAQMQTSINSMVSKANTDGLIPIILTCTVNESWNQTQIDLQNELNQWIKDSFDLTIDITKIVEIDSKLLRGFPISNYNNDGVHYGFEIRKSVAKYIAESGLFEFIKPTDYQKTTTTFDGKTVIVRDPINPQEAVTKQYLENNAIFGTGITNYISKWSGSNSQVNSLIFDNGTNVGINTTSPLSRFHIVQSSAGTISWSPTAGTSTIFESGTSNRNFVNIVAPSNGQSELWFSDNLGEGRGRLRYNHVDDSLALWTSVTPRLNITSAGDIGIGTTTPSSKLEVDGTIRGVDGLRKTINNKTANYTIVTSDYDKLITTSGSSNINITVNTGSLVNIGETAEIEALGTGTVTIVAGTATLRRNAGDSLTLDGQYSRVAVQKISSTEYRVFGQLAPIDINPVFTISSNYTVDPNDKNKLIITSGSSNINITINSGSLNTIGDKVEIESIGTGTVTVVQGTSTLRKNAGDTFQLDGQYSRIAIQRITATDYKVFGQLLTV